MDTEIWKDIPGYEWLYQASSLGRIKSLKRKADRMIRLSHDTNWYHQFSLYKHQSHKHGRVHRIVAQLFISNPDKKFYINHINGLKDDNRVENLEWCTASENTRHAWDSKLAKVSMNNHFKLHNPGRWKFGSKNHWAKGVTQITIDGLFIQSWWSLMDARRATWINQSSISMCCNNKRKSAGGFVWKFII